MKFFTSGFNWIPEISRQPIIFRNCSISTFDRHMKLNTSAKFHDFNQKSYNPCTYPPPRPVIFNFTPSDLIHPRYCRSADARVRMQIALLLTALIQEWYLIKCDQKRTKPSPGWLSWERRVWWTGGHGFEPRPDQHPRSLSNWEERKCCLCNDICQWLDFLVSRIRTKNRRSHLTTLTLI